MKSRSGNFVSRCVVSFGILVFCLAELPASAQVSAGLAGISGVVHDSAGAVVPNAQVVVANPSKGVRIVLNTSEGGVFNVPSLAPAAGYDFTVDKQGFAQYEVKDITLSVGQDLNLVVGLSIAGASERIEVVATAPLVDTTKSDVSQVINSDQILDLPINGRRVDTFALLTPSVTNDGNFGLLTFNGVANGNNFLLDGNDSTSQFWVENNGRTRVLSAISQDVVQEFQVVSTNYSSEYGRAMGGVVNTITRSGSDDYHGTAYFFYRNQNMLARDPFSTLSYVPNQWRLQSGASVGGPIVKDKLFFFINGEAGRVNFPLQDTITGPVIDSVNQAFLPYGASNSATANTLGCNSTVVQAGLQIATPAQCAAINKLLPRFFGLIPRTVTEDLGFARIDYNLSKNNTLSASFNYMWYVTPNGLQSTVAVSTSGGGVNSNGNDYARTRNGKFTWSSIIGSNLVNQFRYGYNTDLEGDNVNSQLNGGLGALALTAASVTLGSINYLPRVEPSETRNEFADDLSWTKGRHIFKFGVDIATTNDYSLFAMNLNGNYSYQNLTAFALDYSGNITGAKNYQTYTQAFGSPRLNTRVNDYDFYVEDQWRVTDKLTATLGARYEYSHLPAPPICNTAFPLTCTVNSPNKNVMPRVGLAYQLNEKTVVRAGYGIFYARIPAAILQDLFTSGNGIAVPSYSLTGANIATYGPVFPNILTSVPGAGGASTVGLQFAAPNFSTPYEEQGTFGVERQVTKDLSITASYIWSRGIHLPSVIDQNLPTTTTPFTYTIDDANGNAVGTYSTQVLLGALKNGVPTTGIRPNATVGALLEDGNGVTSFYNALAVQVNKRFSHGFMANLSYTWSHEIDDGQGYGQSTNTFYGSSPNQWLTNGDFQQDRGNGLEDQPQRLVMSWIWTPTIVHREGAFYKYAVNNWQLSSITTINGSRPYGSPTISVSGTPVTGMFSNFSLNGIGFSGRVPFLPVDSVWQPARYQADIRLTKIFPISDRYRAAFNLEIFNISNSWSPTSMNTSAYTESGGVLKPVTSATRAGTGSGDSAPPDGTEARRLQISARFTF